MTASTTRTDLPPITPERQQKVSKALKFFRVAAYTTGVFLILLVIRMVLEYGFKLDIPAWATLVAIIHGWVYMAYVVSVALLGMAARWHPLKWLTTALAGVVPFLSFFVEANRTREVKRDFQLA